MQQFQAQGIQKQQQQFQQPQQQPKGKQGGGCKFFDSGYCAMVKCKE